MSRRRIFLDQDGPLANFDGYMKKHNLKGDQIKVMEGAYLNLEPTVGAIEGVKSLNGMGKFDLWIATKPPVGIPFACADKVSWILKHFPDLKRKIIITHDKGLLGDYRDFLVDDRPHKANCESFAGTLIPFKDGMDWPQLIDYFRKAPREISIRKATYKILQSVGSVQRQWLETVYDGGEERLARLEYDRLVAENPDKYFELVVKEHREECLAFTPKKP
jgi:5'(3')-deoxyribonucleotidase